MKTSLLLFFLFTASLSFAQVGQSGGGGGPSADPIPKELSRAELAEVGINLDAMVLRAKGKWMNCTQMSLPDINNFYELYKNLIYLQMADEIHIDDIIPGTKKMVSKECKAPLLQEPPPSKLYCVLDQADLNFIAYILNTTSTYQIFKELGQVPESEFVDVDKFMVDVILKAPQPVVDK